MIKNNKHDTYVKRVPDIIRDVVLNDTHSLTEEESFYFREDEFFAENDVFMEQMGFPSVPLVVYADGKGNKTISLHPKFMMQLDADFAHSDFNAYRYLFAQRFEIYEAEKGQEQEPEEEGLGEFQEKDEPEEKPIQKFGDKIQEPPKKIFDEEGAAELNAARARNADYAIMVAQDMFEDTGQYPDNYGMIENRRTLFFEEMDMLCDGYALPRLRIGFDEEDVPFFDADPDTIAKVKELYADRKAHTARVMKEFKDDPKIAGMTLNILRTSWSGIDNPKIGFDAEKQVIAYAAIFADNGGQITINGGHVPGNVEKKFKPIVAGDFSKLIYN